MLVFIYIYIYYFVWLQLITAGFDGEFKGCRLLQMLLHLQTNLAVHLPRCTCMVPLMYMHIACMPLVIQGMHEVILIWKLSTFETRKKRIVYDWHLANAFDPSLFMGQNSCINSWMWEYTCTWLRSRENPCYLDTDVTRRWSQAWRFILKYMSACRHTSKHHVEVFTFP